MAFPYVPSASRRVVALSLLCALAMELELAYAFPKQVYAPSSRPSSGRPRIPCRVLCPCDRDEPHTERAATSAALLLPALPVLHLPCMLACMLPCMLAIDPPSP